jgi:signal transduction histidine kinase/anti-sigma regulatory factor (Ser/Thr protein kinase)
MSGSLPHLIVRNEQDIVAVRQRSRQIASLLGFGTQDQTRIATAVSEVTRIVFAYARRARIAFVIDDQNRPPSLQMRVSAERRESARENEDDRRPCSPLQVQGDAAFAGACRLMDWCDIVPEMRGAATGDTTAIVLGRYLPADTQLSAHRLADISSQLREQPSADGMAELEQQNRELVQALAELRTRQEELTTLTRELEDTNRGVVALYAEIEEKAERLRRSDEMKSRFLSNTSHELRTPLSSIRALSQLLLDRIDGDLTPEQETQVTFIKTAAIDLSELVNDLLDLAKIEAGKVAIVRSVFSVTELFGALRAMLEPLRVSDSVALIFEEPSEDIQLDSDEGKVSQILRNLVFNALKFTEAGDVRVSVTVHFEGRVCFKVVDTGIGIDEAHLPLIFEEFGQVENRLQKHGKGTGLGLPLCQKLAELLGGTIEVVSKPGAGSSFSLLLPLRPPASDDAGTELI